ncbi:MAG: hypothetical protein ABIO70_23945 [Pseudomonadota bacterium]
MTLLLPLLLAGCGLWIYEEPDEGGLVSWSGAVLDGPSADAGVFSGGDLTAWGLDGVQVAEGEEPWADSPGTWRLKVPPEQPVAIHLAGEGMLPSVWRGTTPAGQGYWYTGALFAYEQATWRPFFEQFDGQHGLSVTALEDGVCWAWFAPDEPEAWAGARVKLSDGEGATEEYLAYTLDDDGILVEPLGGPLDHLFAFDLAPGHITLSVQTVDGRAMRETWPCWAGEIVTGWFLALPAEPS